MKNSDIRKIATWPPGSIMVFDNAMVIEESRKSDLAMIDAITHFGFGLVVANDGDKRIHVIWDSNCSKAYLSYDVRFLNPKVIYRVE